MELLLRKGELLDLGKSACGGTVHCLEGDCWLTCTGQPGDHLLGAGESLPIKAKGALLLNALRDCRIQIQPARPEVRTEGLKLQLL